MNFKRVISAVMAVTMISAAAVPVLAAHKFSDIEGNSYEWAADEIDKMSEAGYITGYEDATFRPDNEVTRLECLALFARAMGSSDDANKGILELAHEDYDTLIKNYSLPWGTDEIAYLLYKGALKKSDLDTYLLSEEKNQPMKRYEAAIIITKALGGEEAALNESGIVLSYTDSKEIPTTAVQYVNYAAKAEIMTGMDDGSFSPKTSVSRAQMAVMLSRTVDATEYEFIEGKLTAVDTETGTITYTDGSGSSKSAEYTADTKMRVLGTLTQPANMLTNVRAVITLANGNIISVDALSEEPDETISGKFNSYSSNSGTVYVSIINSENKTVAYPCDTELSVTYAGSPATVRSFKSGDAIELTLTDGKITSITGNEKEITIKNAEITDMDISAETVKITISSADKEYDGQTYEVDSKVTVKKNNTESDLSNIFVGDTVNITLQYDVIKSISATSSTKTIEGIIEAITIQSPRSSMDVNVGGNIQTYAIPAEVTILINNEAGTLYDFRVGDSVKITTENSAITKIVASTTQTASGSITGVVIGINSSFGFISVRDDDGNSPQIFCKDTTTTFISAAGDKKKLANIEIGQTVTVRYTVSNGAFIGTLVIIE